MSVTERLRRNGVNGISPGEIGAEADRIDEEVAGNYVRLPVGGDGEPVRPGDVVYGGDGRGWRVVGIGTGTWPVVVVPEGSDSGSGEFQRMRAAWCRHRPPLATVGRAVRSIARKGIGISIRDIAELESVAALLEGWEE